MIIGQQHQNFVTYIIFSISFFRGVHFAARTVHTSPLAFSSSLLIARNHLSFFKIFSNFVNFCSYFQIFCSFLSFFNIFLPFSLKNRTHALTFYDRPCLGWVYFLMVCVCVCARVCVCVCVCARVCACRKSNFTEKKLRIPSFLGSAYVSKSCRHLQISNPACNKGCLQLAIVWVAYTIATQGKTL